MKFYCIPLLLLLNACNYTEHAPTTNSAAAGAIDSPVKQRSRHFRGIVLNGMKGDSLFFDVSEDGTKLQNLEFKGYWRCNGRLEQTRVGPDGSFEIRDGKVAGHLSEPPGGGSTAWRFELDALLNENTAQGNFRMNINNLGCDTYKLQWRAEAIK